MPEMPPPAPVSCCWQQEVSGVTAPPQVWPTSQTCTQTHTQNRGQARVNWGVEASWGALTAHCANLWMWECVRGCFLLDLGQRCKKIHPGHGGYSNNVNTITAVILDHYFHINCLHFPFIKTSVTTITTRLYPLSSSFSWAWSLWNYQHILQVLRTGRP